MPLPIPVANWKVTAAPDGPFGGHPSLNVDLIEHWRLNGNLFGEKGVIDMAGSPSYTSGLFGKLAAVIDSNTSTSITNRPLLNPSGSFSWFFWYYANPPQGDYYGVMDKITSNQGYEIFTNNADAFYFRVGTGSAQEQVFRGFADWNYSEWTSVSVTYDSAVPSISMLVNDVQKNVTTMAAPISHDTSTWRLGFSAPNFHMCSLSFWHKALSTQEETDLHAGLEY